MTLKLKYTDIEQLHMTMIRECRPLMNHLSRNSAKMQKKVGQIQKNINDVQKFFQQKQREMKLNKFPQLKARLRND
jgi:hypothetical protein